MSISTQSLPDARRSRTLRWQPAGYWLVTGALAAAALLVPRRPLLKEWAYAGAFFVYTGAIVSHLATGYDVAEVGVLAILTVLTVLSWALRPASRRTPPAAGPSRAR